MAVCVRCFFMEKNYSLSLFKQISKPKLKNIWQNSLYSFLVVEVTLTKFIN